MEHTEMSPFLQLAIQPGQVSSCQFAMLLKCPHCMDDLEKNDIYVNLSIHLSHHLWDCEKFQPSVGTLNEEEKQKEKRSLNTVQNKSRVVY